MSLRIRGRERTRLFPFEQQGRPPRGVMLKQRVKPIPFLFQFLGLGSEGLWSFVNLSTAYGLT